MPTDPIQTVSRLTITAAERDRANVAIAALDAATVTVAELRATVASQAALIAELQAPVPQPPPLPVRPPRLHIAGGRFYTRGGAQFVNRGIELMYGNDDFNVGPVEICRRLKALGANSVAPLFQGSNGSVARVKAFCDAARAEGLICWVNADHQPNGRAWLCAPEMVALLNGYDHVGLECEVETDSVDSVQEWLDGAGSLVRDVRAAGHKSIIKAGAPQGGRRVEFPLVAGEELLALDPLGQVCFTFQAYWGKTGTWYQSCAGAPSGVAGTKQALTRVASSGLCFLVGFDWHDDVGETDELALIDHADSLGVSWQHWAFTGDGTLTGNNMIDRFDWTRSLASITANGIALQSRLLARRTFAAL